MFTIARSKEIIASSIDKGKGLTIKSCDTLIDALLKLLPAKRLYTPTTRASSSNLLRLTRTLRTNCKIAAI